MQIRHILIATDLSDIARRAYAPAAALAKLHHARVTLIHVNEASLYAQHTAAELMDYMENYARTAADSLTNEAEQLTSAWGIAVDTVNVTGRASDRVIEWAEDNDVDVICVVKSGARLDRRVLLGSTTQRITARSPIPVLVVDASGDPPEQVTLNRIAVTTDWTDESGAGIQAALEIAEAADAKVEVLHALPMPVFVPVIPGEPPLVFPKELLDAQKIEKEKELKEVVKQLGEDRLSYRVLVGGAVGEAIVDVSEDYDLLIMPSHGKGALERFFIGSTTVDVVRLSRKPVLVLPPTWLLEQMEGE